jgi:hypothetical protein
MENDSAMILTRENRTNQSKTCPSATLSTKCKLYLRYPYHRLGLQVVGCILDILSLYAALYDDTCTHGTKHVLQKQLQYLFELAPRKLGFVKLVVRHLQAYRIQLV